MPRSFGRSPRFFWNSISIRARQRENRAGYAKTPDKEDTMKIFQIMLVVTLFAFTASAREYRRVCRDSRGCVTGTITKPGNRSTYRDNFGPVRKTATTYGNRTVYRDKYGLKIGTRTVIGNKAFYRDALGRRRGTSRTVGRITTYRNSQGLITGTATRSRSGAVYYRNTRGQFRGTRR